MKTFAVIGLGQFGYQVAISLTQKGFEVVGLDNDPEIVSEIKDFVSEAIILDVTDEKSMRSVDIDHVDEAIVAIGSNVQSSLLCTALLQRMGISTIHVRVINPLQESILKTMGITNIISIEKEMGIQLTNSITSQGVGRYIAISNRHSLIETLVPTNLVGKTLKELSMRSQYRINIVGIKTQEPVTNDDGEITFITKMTDVPDPNYPLQKHDILVIAGTDEHLKNFIRVGEEISS